MFAQWMEVVGAESLLQGGGRRQEADGRVYWGKYLVWFDYRVGYRQGNDRMERGTRARWKRILHFNLRNLVLEVDCRF